MTKIFSVDAETDGLYGKVWAIGAVVLETDDDVSRELARFEGQINSDVVTDLWVRENIVGLFQLTQYLDRGRLLNAFWDFWMEHKKDAICLADFGAPVEAALFRACVELDPEQRTWEGPYPLHELGTALLCGGRDPDIDRRKFGGMPNLVQHDPVDDALAAAHCWHRLVICRQR